MQDQIPKLVASIESTANAVSINFRRVDSEMRELVIGRGSRGHVALYRHVEAIDMVFVLAIRSQRELGYRAGD